MLLLSTAAVASTATLAAPAHAASALGITREQEIQNASTWLTANNGGPVPYSQEHTWSDGYRQDCSGFASMALGPPAPGPNTVGLANDGWTTSETMSDLKQGDLVIHWQNDSSDLRHVVIFDHWTDDAHTAYYAYEQAGGVGTEYTTESYGVSGNDGYSAYHPVNLTD